MIINTWRLYALCLAGLLLVGFGADSPDGLVSTAIQMVGGFLCAKAMGQMYKVGKSAA